MKHTLLHGDCLKLLPTISDNSVDSIVTDPPYEIGFMGKSWDNTGIAYNIDMWMECIRILKPGGHLLAFGGTRTYHRIVCAIEDAGFEIRDQMQWIYGSGFPKSQNVSAFIDKELGVVGNRGELKKNLHSRGDHKSHVGWQRPWQDDSEVVEAGMRQYIPISSQAIEFDGFGTALKPAHEPIVLARKPLEKGLTVAQNVLKWRTGALNIGACRVPAAAGDAPVSWETPRGGIWKTDSKAKAELITTGEGRWPANICHDGSAEVIEAFPITTSGGGNKANRKPPSRESQVMPTIDTGQIWQQDIGSAARFFYSAKASKSDRNGSKHPTVKPINLISYLCRLVTPSGGTVLTPFAGSGTLASACEREQFNCIMIEKEKEYIEDIERRVNGLGLGAELVYESK